MQKTPGLTISLRLLLLILASVVLSACSKDVGTVEAMPVTASETQWRSADAVKDKSKELAPVDGLVEGLKTRLMSEPEDIESWLLLTKSYQYLERWDDANWAFSQAQQQGYAGERPSTSGDHSGSSRGDPLVNHVRSEDVSWLTRDIYETVTKKE